jgi:hypothetical protein
VVVLMVLLLRALLSIDNIEEFGIEVVDDRASN